MPFKRHFCLELTTKVPTIVNDISISTDLDVKVMRAHPVLNPSPTLYNVNKIVIGEKIVIEADLCV